MATTVPYCLQSIRIKEQFCGGFDTKYPDQLDGIINRNDYQQSITNINRKCTGYKFYISLCITVTIILICAILLLIVGISIMPTHNVTGYFLIFGVNILFLVSAVLYAVVIMKQGRQLKKVVSEESEKYATRWPKGCIWRLKDEHTRHSTRRCVSNRISF